MKITRKELVKTAKEFNELMGLEPAIKTTKEVSEEELLQQISMASEMLEEDDEISEVVEAVLDFIAEQGEAEESPEPEDADDDVDEEDEEEEDETTAQLVEKSDYRAMKAMVAEYPEFKGIDINLYPIKKTEELRARMLKVLAKAAGKEEKPKEEKPKKEKKEKETKGISQTEFIRQSIRKKIKKETLVKNLAAQFSKTDKWAENRVKLYEKAYGTNGVNDSKIAE